MISTVLFDNVSEVIHDRVPVQRVEPMTDRDYCICSPFPKASFHLFANPIFGFVIPCPKCPIHSTNNVAVGLSRKSGSIAGRYTYSCHSHCGLLYGGRRSFTLIFSFSTQLQECLLAPKKHPSRYIHICFSNRQEGPPAHYNKNL